MLYFHHPLSLIKAASFVKLAKKKELGAEHGGSTVPYKLRNKHRRFLPESVQEPDQANLSVLAAEVLMARVKAGHMKRETPKPAKQGIATIGQSTSHHDGGMTLDHRFPRVGLTSGVIRQHTLVYTS